MDDTATLQAVVDAWNARPDDSESWSLVHGGGPQLDAALREVQGPAVKIAGLRVTSPAGADAALKTLDGIGAALAAALAERGVPAVHVPASLQLLRAITKRVPDGDLGRVGTPLRFDVQSLADLVPPGTLAVVTPIGWDDEGPLNINADEAASALAGAIQAARLVLATDVDHVLDAQGQAIEALTAESARDLIASGVAKGGMIPKLESALLALTHGASEVVIGRAAAAWSGQGTRVRAKVPLPAQWDDVMLNNYGTPALTLTHGQGSRVWDHEERAYTDLLGGIAVNILGHAHPAVTAAAKAQLDTLMHTSNLYAHLPGLQLAKRLRDRAPGHRVFFANSGTEANEAALKLIRRHAHATDRADGIVLAFTNGFHGRTAGALALTGQPKYQKDFAPLPGQIVHVAYNDVAAIQAAFADNKVVGVFTEAIQGEGGIVPLTQEAADTIQALCREHNALLVLDEVQTGVGRTGRFFAFEHFGLDPDVITLAKGIAGGLPLGVALIRDDLAALLGPGSHGTTFGGNPVSCAAANAVLQTLEDEDLVALASRKGALIERLLDDAGIAHRGMGLLQGILHDDPGAVVAQARQGGVLVGQAGKAVRLAPALNISEGVLLEAVQRVVAGLSPAPAR